MTAVYAIEMSDFVAESVRFQDAAGLIATADMGAQFLLGSLGAGKLTVGFRVPGLESCYL